MKIQAYYLSALTLLWSGSEVAEAAVKLHEQQEGRLSGAFLAPEWGVVTTGNHSTERAAARAFDGSRHTTWLVKIKEDKCHLDFQFNDGASWVVTDYSIVNGTVDTSRDPRKWELQGSHDGENWATLDARDQQNFVGRRWAKAYRPKSAEAYNRYRFIFTPVDQTLLEVAEVDLVVRARVVPPTGLTADAERGSVVLNWRPVDTATGYTVRRAVRRDGPYTVVASGVAGTRYADKGPFEASETSYYTVASEASATPAVMSLPVSVVTPVNAPAGLQVKQGDDSVVLAWTPAPKAVAYVVRRALRRDGPYAVIGSGITAPGYADEGLSAGTAYYYKVCGVANGKEGCDTEPAGALFPPLAPTGLAAKPEEKSITLSWNAVPLVKSYKLLRAIPDGETKEELATVVDATVFTDETAEPKQSYVYTVVAVNDCGASEESTSVSATRIPPPRWWRR